MIPSRLASYRLTPITRGVRTVESRARPQGIGVNDMDLLIGATALIYDLTVVTHNTRHFRNIPGLRLEDWRTALKRRNLFPSLAGLVIWTTGFPLRPRPRCASVAIGSGDPAGSALMQPTASGLWRAPSGPGV